MIQKKPKGAQLRSPLELQARLGEYDRHWSIALGTKIDYTLTSQDLISVRSNAPCFRPTNLSISANTESGSPTKFSYRITKVPVGFFDKNS